ncbi:hypothetical protein [Demequina sp. NBRC 110057]|uniref:hypothetical protein n=1 Tax=Demequina sp. NBRC 110057 TaxID=1570346 RepID=UPI0011781336|nr:hypothetical protein [Demequina sp. NBRC 110057]
METLLGVVLGMMTGIGVASVHPLLDPGKLLALAVGALGGWIGTAWWGPMLTPHLADHSFAGAAVGGALGGAALALVGGIALAIWRRSARD